LNTRAAQTSSLKRGGMRKLGAVFQTRNVTSFCKIESLGQQSSDCAIGAREREHHGLQRRAARRDSSGCLKVRRSPPRWNYLRRLEAIIFARPITPNHGKGARIAKPWWVPGGKTASDTRHPRAKAC
jgi:hypothetical protein